MEPIMRIMIISSMSTMSWVESRVVTGESAPANHDRS
jgi:hypothetical protein